ncbi:MAG: N-acetyl-gamma-glutamyl-phosphate reductase [Brevinematia bacterium]
MEKIKVGIVGASGYTASELIKILLKHPFVEISLLTSRSLSGVEGYKIFPEIPNLKIKFSNTEEVTNILDKIELDLVFLTLPHEPAIEFTHIFHSKGIKVIDLSASYRFKNREIFEETYKIHHPYPDLLKKAVWGLPELFREQIRKAEIVGNPGCYPTSISLALLPLKEIKNNINLSNIIIDSKSGISGKGKKVSEDSLFVEHNENFYAYGIPLHRHTPEIEQFIEFAFNEKVKVLFVPHVVPMDRGIFSTIYIESENLNQKDIEELYRSFYEKEPFVHVVETIPQTKWVSNTNNCMIYPKVIERSGKVIIFSVIDNLVKGASGQAVQNMNIMFNFEETTSLM